MKKTAFILLIAAMAIPFTTIGQKNRPIAFEAYTLAEPETVDPYEDASETRDPNTPEWVNDFMYKNHQFANFQSIEEIGEYVSSVYNGTGEYRKYIVPTKNPVSDNMAKKIASEIISTPIVRVKEGIEYEQLWLRYTVSYAYPMRYVSYVYVIDDIKYTIRFFYYDSEGPFEPSTSSLGEVKVGPHTYEMYKNGPYTLWGEKMVGNIIFQLRISYYENKPIEDDLSILNLDAFEFFTMEKDGSLSEYVYVDTSEESSEDTESGSTQEVSNTEETGTKGTSTFENDTETVENAQDKNGCASTLSGSAALAVSIVSAGVIVRKRKKKTLYN